MKKAMFVTMAALATAFLLMAQDLSKFNGTWKGEEGGQIRKLTVKDGVIYMEETQPGGRLILRQYPFKGQEITMTEGVWKDSKATGKVEGNKMIVETTMPNGTEWHDEWTMAADGKSYAALRQMVKAGTGGAFGGAAKGGAPAAGAPKGGEGAAKGGGQAKGSSNVPETFVRVE